MCVQYNIITIPLICIYIICSSWYIVDIIRKQNTLNNVKNKNKNLIIIICVVLFFVSLIKNIENPLLY